MSERVHSTDLSSVSLRSVGFDLVLDVSAKLVEACDPEELISLLLRHNWICLLSFGGICCKKSLHLAEV
jgi:hypothetical protein